MADIFEVTETAVKHESMIDNRLHPEELLLAVYLLDKELVKLSLTETKPFVKYGDMVFSIVNDRLLLNGSELHLGYQTYQDQELFVVPMTEVKTTFFHRDERRYLEISQAEKAAIQTTGQEVVQFYPKGVVIEVPEDSFVYFDTKRLSGSNYFHDFQVGDSILTPDYLLEKRREQLKLTAFNSELRFVWKKLLHEPYYAEYPADFPDYRRSPRLNLEPATNKFTFQKIKEKPKTKGNAIWGAILPPLAMLAISVAVSLATGRNPLMMLSMGVMSIATACGTVTKYFRDKKHQAAEDLQTEEEYESYLLDVSAKVGLLYKEETKILNYKMPAPDQLCEMMKRYDSRIYERMRNNKDFLELSLGTGDRPSALTVDSEASERDSDENSQRLRKLVAHYSTQREVPITMSIADQTLGFIGSYDLLKKVSATLLLETAFFHSYRDVNFVSLVPEKSYKEDWSDWRFLPHFKIQERNVRGLVHNAQTRDVVLNSLWSVLKERKQLLQEAGKEKPQFAPHYILTIFDDSYLSGHGINELLAEDMSELGVTVIWCKEDKKLLPETVTGLVTYYGQDSAEIVNDHSVHLAKAFRPYEEPEHLEEALSYLSNLNHVEVEKNAIPESLSLLEQYDVKRVEDLNISGRWAEAVPNKSIKSLIGWRGKSDYVYWDLHERVHGPHALVGGTTGSGKSEFLTTYLIGLAINFSPEDIGMLVIDWKGGGIANTLAGLPHFMGSITNLDGAGTARALASIKAELDKRMIEFAKYGVNNINGYMSLYKERLHPKADKNYPTKPIPHLILVSDEFAELKSNVPEFLDELTSVARIGRSLGVHLILATQKPAGVVNDQIEANSQSRIALKMSKADSKALIKTEDSGTITQPGRGYLKVGENEVYELFQSGYAGVPYNPEEVEEEVIDERFYKINDFGQVELLLDPQEEAKQGKDTSDLPSQLEAVITEINEVFKISQYALPDKPWLPNLEVKIVTPEVEQSVEVNTKIPLGLLDIPSKQTQEIYTFDIRETSHTAIFGSSGFGKSTILHILVLNLSRQNTPEQVQFNLLDFGTNGLLPLKDLPHVADIVMLEEVEKLQKMLERIQAELAERKGLFKKAGVASLAQYEAKTSEKIPLILNILDSYDGLTQQDRRKEAIDNLLIQILREGAALGVYLILTSNRVGAIRMNMMSNIQTKMALFLNDESELVTLFGRNRVMQSEIMGRGQLVYEVPTSIQFFLPVKGETSAKLLESLEGVVKKINEAWTGSRPKQIPMVPEELPIETFNELEEVKDWQAVGKLPFGMSYQTTDILGFLPKAQPYFLLAPADDEQMLFFQKLLLVQLSKAGNETILVDFDNKFEELSDELEGLENVSLKNQEEDIDGIIDLMGDYVVAGKQKEQKNKKLLVIADLENFIAKTEFPAENFTVALKQTYKAGLDLIIFSPHQYIAKSVHLVPKAIRSLKFTGVIGARVYDSPLIKSTGNSAEAELPTQDAYFVLKGGSVFSKMKLPMIELED